MYKVLDQMNCIVVGLSVRLQTLADGMEKLFRSVWAVDFARRNVWCRSQAILKSERRDCISSVLYCVQRFFSKDLKRQGINASRILMYM